MGPPEANGPDRKPEFRVSLFDADGLPWASRLSVGWLLFLAFVTSFFAAIPLGIYLGLWLRNKGRTGSVLCIYLLLTALCVVMFLPDRFTPSGITDAVSASGLALWFLGAFMFRHQVKQYYSGREGSEFHLSLLLTGPLSVWYINASLRPDFPLVRTGTIPDGVLELPN